VVFSYGGDLWLASTDGGTARRLTAHPGQEVFARFSPNGEWVTSRSTSCRPREANRHA
jgi:tricorn protease